MKKLMAAAMGCFLLVSCDPNISMLENEVDAYVPVYASSTEIKNIAVESPKPTEQAGKIYVYGNYIFQNDLYKGVHIIDNTNKKTPQKLAFLKIPFCTELSVKGNYLYANNQDDIVVFDLASIGSPKLVNRLEHVFPAINQAYPPFNNTYFECVDPKKGVVVRWELKHIKSPGCRR